MWQSKLRTSKRLGFTVLSKTFAEWPPTRPRFLSVSASPSSVCQDGAFSAQPLVEDFEDQNYRTSNRACENKTLCKRLHVCECLSQPFVIDKSSPTGIEINKMLGFYTTEHYPVIQKNKVPACNSVTGSPNASYYRKKASSKICILHDRTFWKKLNIMGTEKTWLADRSWRW